MEAVIKAGGKQQRVKTGDVIEVELMKGIGDTVEFTPLLVIDDDGATHAGKSAASATVTAKPLGEKKGDKVRVLRFRPKTGYNSQIGHRQQYTLLEITDVKMGSGAKKNSAAKPAAKSAPKSTPKSTAKSTAKAAAKPKASAKKSASPKAGAEG
ncbi:MAG: 50S ribosomal protein L21 [Actinomycetota bacterium]